MEDVIKKSLEGGYKIKDLILKEGEMFAFRKMESLSELFGKCVLDPLFWQALGKACGWNDWKYDYRIEHNELENINPKYIDINFIKKHNYRDFPWKAHALRFHEINLTEGWSAAVNFLRSVCGMK